MIAFGRGGALDTVRPLALSAADTIGDAPAGAATGILFERPDTNGLLDALTVFERHEHAFDPKPIRAHAERFSTERFLHEIGEEIEATLSAGARHGAAPVQ
ncbi:MAG TPA: hypothetical protein ENO23_04730 [Alphaproteobacteria bacterium]|nr:hypothetical protein [Alphaproteobacteria bacterium]